jgi:3-oxoacyl-[acyl-carrier protein] reductase
MNLGLTDRVALVTAASRGFGRAVATALAAEGAHVAVCARSEEALKAAAAVVDAAGPGRVIARPTDVTDPQALAQLVRETEERLGPIDCCLVNVGGPPPGGWADLRPAQFEAAYALLVDSAVRLTRLVLPGMTRRGWGRIVQITSVTVRQPVPNLTLSNVLRPAVHALTKVLAQEAAPHGVTVNSVAPGHHATDRVEALTAAQAERDGSSVAEVRADHEKEIPAGRLGEPAELAALVAFLMSEQAAFITGQCIVADGGWVRGTF